MTPIRFACQATLPLTPEEVAEQILDVTRWPEFQGYGPIPGIKTAAFEVRTPDVVGSRIRVTNLDGSTHVEEITVWQTNERIQLRMGGFSPPLSRLATEFLETWQFGPAGIETKVTRSFEMYAKSVWAKPVLWCISFLLKGAISRHLNELSRATKVASNETR